MTSDLLLTEDLDECAPENVGLRAVPCESYEDGGICNDFDGYSTCGCREGFMLMETGPAKGQCLQTRFVPPGHARDCRSACADYPLSLKLRFRS